MQKKVLMSHIITIDIGNTRAKYAIFKNDEIIETATFNPYNNDLKEVVKKYPTITRGILSSVGGKVEECLKQMEGIEVFILSGSAPLPFKMGYNDKEQYALGPAHHCHPLKTVRTIPMTRPP